MEDKPELQGPQSLHTLPLAPFPGSVQYALGKKSDEKSLGMEGWNELPRRSDTRAEAQVLAESCVKSYRQRKQSRANITTRNIQ